jgi:hypothetical protein
MLSLFKTFGKGLLYTVTLPITLLILLGYMIYGVFYFLFLSIKSIVLFFKGKTIFSELEEDVKAREILTGVKEEKIYIDGKEEIYEEKPQEISSFNMPIYTIPTSPIINNETNPTPKEDVIESEDLDVEEHDIDEFELLDEPDEINEEIIEEEIIEEETKEELPPVINKTNKVFFEDDNNDYDSDGGVSIVPFDEEEDY